MQCNTDMLDLILIVILIISVIFGYKRGFIKSVKGTAAWAITIIAVMAAVNPAVELLSSMPIAERINSSVYETVINKIGSISNDELSLSQLTGLPEWAVDNADAALIGAVGAVNDGIENAVRSVADGITEILIKIIAVTGMFVLLRILLGALFGIAERVFKLPILNGANRGLGAILSLVGAILVVYIVAAAVSIFVNPSVYEYINKTMLVKEIFNNNILMQLFIK